MKYTVLNTLFRKPGLCIGGFSGSAPQIEGGPLPETQYAIAVGGWNKEKSAFRWRNFVPVDANTYLTIAHKPKRAFDFTYKGKTRRFNNVEALAVFLNENDLTSAAN